jgi:tetratricopeptide (TPR) repeat protein
LILLLATLLSATAVDTPVDALPEPLRPVFEEAERAWREGRPGAAEAAYARLNDEVPEFDRAFRRRCGVLLEQGRNEEAIALCREAVSLKDSVENRTGLAIALTKPPEGSSGYRDELDEARKLLDAIVEQDADYLPAWQAMCTWAVEALDDDALDSCVEVLSASDPTNPGTLYFLTLQHMALGEVDLATRTLTQARQAGLPDAQYKPLALRLGAEGQRPDPEALQRARALIQGQQVKGPVGFMDALPWFLAGGLVLGVGVLLFLAEDEDEDDSSGEASREE